MSIELCLLAMPAAVSGMQGGACAWKALVLPQNIAQPGLGGFKSLFKAGGLACLLSDKEAVALVVEVQSCRLSAVLKASESVPNSLLILLPGLQQTMCTSWICLGFFLSNF